ncbi:glutamate receptor-like isoform X2 [Liolophura sinensis]|uniref:glutamate receptor-like isoform X2 n=1 Tax=Liolophura sinensis TaxID=3198878 RepID=UPI003158784E
MLTLKFLLATIVVAVLPMKASQDTVPVGAIFDRDSVEIHTAFRFKIQDVNINGQLRAKLNFTVALIDVKDSYTLSERMCSLMSHGVFSLFGVTKSGSVNAAQSISQALHMPFITPSLARGTADDLYQYEINMYPSYIEAIVDIINYYKWGKVYYVYDSDDGLARLIKLYEFFNEEHHELSVDMRRVDDVSDAYEMLRKLDRSALPDEIGVMRIVLDLSSMEAYRAILRQIIDVGMNRENYHYLLGGVGMDELDLTIFTYGGVNITGFRLLNYSSPTLKGFLRTWSSLSNESWPRPLRGRIGHEAALMVDAVAAFSKAMGSMNHSVSQGVFRRGELYNNNTPGIPCSRPGVRRPSPWTLGPNILSAIKQTEFTGITGKVAFDEHGFRKDYTLDILELSYRRLPTKIGTWNQRDRYLTDRPRPHDMYRIEDFSNTTYIVTSIKSEPFMIERAQPEDGHPLVGNDRYEGYCMELTEKLSVVLGFDYLVELVKDGQYGSRRQNGTWNGMVGTLIRGEAHMAVAPLTITEDRERVIDFTKPFMKTGISIMIKEPVKQKAGVFSFMNPLSKRVWACIILGYFGVSLILYIVGRFSPYEWHEANGKADNGETVDKVPSELTNEFTFQNTLWFSLGALMQQGSDISPRSISGRIVGSCWWFFTLIIISSYTANLAAFLTIENMLTPIDSADDLVKQTKIQYGIQEGGSSEQFFKNTKVSVYKKMWDYMSNAQPRVFEPDTLSGVNRVRKSKGRYAFLLESPWNEYYNQQLPCDTMKVGPNLDSKGYGVGTPDRFPLKAELNREVLKLRESGELWRLQQKWWYDRGKCGSVDGKESKKQDALTLSNVSGVFHILIGGLGLAMMTALVEYLFQAKLRPKKTKASVEINSSRDCRKRARMSQLYAPTYGERENGGYSFTPPGQLVTFEGVAEGNTQTQV